MRDESEEFGSESAHAQFADREKATEAAKQSGKTERGSHICPKCGDEFRNLPAHLPACDGGETA